MPHLERANLRSLTVYVGEQDYHQRQRLREMFLAGGVKNVSLHSNIESLRSLMFDIPPDLLVLSDNFDPDMFDLVRDVRFSQIGFNPFIGISILVTQNKGDNIHKAIYAGADDIVIKPIDTKKIHERLRLIAFYRQPFIATNEYFGPDRKGEYQSPSDTHRVRVLNTIKEKAQGRNFGPRELKEAINESMGRVVESQLTSHIMKMGLPCEAILAAYRDDIVTEEVKNDLATLTGILSEAGTMAKRIGDTLLEGLCSSLAENVSAMTDKYDSLTEVDMELIEKLAQAFRMAVDSASERKQKGRDAILEISEEQAVRQDVGP